MKLTNIIQDEYKNIQKKDIKAAILPKRLPKYELLEYTYSLIEKHYENRHKRAILQDIYSEAQTFFIEKKQNKKITKETIESFVDLLPYFEGQDWFSYTGFVISAMINTHYKIKKQKEKYILKIDHLKKTIDGIGFALDGPSLHIIGNIGCQNFNYMMGGIATIFGNAIELGSYKTGGTIEIFGNSYFTGQKHAGGSIYVHGNCSSFLAEEMIGGNIIVDGDCGKSACERMMSGTVTIKKNADENFCSDLRGGTVFLKGKTKYVIAKNMERGTIYLNNKIKISKKIIGGTIFVNERAVYQK